MSDDYILLVPKDPRFIPSESNQRLAHAKFAEIAPDAEEITTKVSEQIEFFDCCANFEKVLCPNCKAEIATDWWQERMSEDATSDGFQLAPYPTPCCQTPKTLNELVYEWPQAFGKYALEGMNANIGELSDELVKEFEKLLATKITVIYQHI